MKIVRNRIVLAAVLATTFAGASLALFLAAPEASDEGPSAFKPGDEGYQRWAQDLEAEGYQVASSLIGPRQLSALTHPETTTWIVLAPTTAWTFQERDAVDAFLSEGGCLWLADPTGVQNTWLLDQGISVSQRLLLQSDSVDPRQVLVYPSARTEGDPLTADSPGSLLINASRDWSTFLASSPSSHLDLDSDGRIDQEDPPGPHVVAASRTTTSNGCVVVIADASIPSDRLWAAANGRWVAGALHPLLDEGGFVVFDESRKGWTSAETPLAQSVHAAQVLQSASTPARVALLAVLGLVVLLPLLFVATIESFKGHETRIPFLQPGRPVATSLRVDVDLAWELLSLRTGEPIQRLRSQGIDASLEGVNEDPLVEKALRGTLTDEERAALYSAYTRRLGGNEP